MNVRTVPPILATSGDHVGRIAPRESSVTDSTAASIGFLERVDDALKPLHDLYRDQNRVDGQVRHCRVASAPGDWMS